MTGWLRLLRLALRRDRVLVPVWVLAVVVSCVASAQATIDLYPTASGRARAAAQVDASPGIRALYGPIADVTSLGALATFKLLLLGGVFVAMLGAVLVRRHTRMEEESGRAEMLAATGTGRHALLAAAVAEGVLVSLLTGLLVALGNAAVGLGLAGSLAFGGAWAGLGLSAVGVTAVCGQLTASTRTAGGLSAAVLGVAYLLRAVADAVGGGWAWLSWVSPFGWAHETRAYAGERWWVLLLPPALLAAGTALAVVLAGRRDLGSGLLATRPGRPRGGLGSVIGLDARLARPGLLGWGAATLAAGAVLGGIAPSATDLVGSPAVADLLRRVGGPGAVLDAFLGTEFAFLALAVTAYGVAALARVAREEDDGRTEQVLAAGTTRSGVLGSAALVALGGPGLLALLCGLGAAVAYGPQRGGVGPALGRLVPAALAPLPAAWVVIGVTLLLLGTRRAWTVLGWGFLALCVLLGQLGELLGLPSALTGLSPYSHVPALPGGPFDPVPELVLTLVAGALAAAGWWRYRSRDLG